MDLSSFISTHPQLVGSSISLGDNSEHAAIASAKLELKKALFDLSRYAGSPSASVRVDMIAFPRRWLLLFAPHRRWVWILHFIFYSSTASLLFLCFSLNDMPDLVSVIHSIGPLPFVSPLVTILFIRYWALMEQRWAEGFRCSASQERVVWLWYLPANRRDLLARWLIVDQFLVVCVQAYSGDDPLFGLWSHPWSQYLVFGGLLLAVFVAYAWARSEFSLSKSNVTLRFPRSLRFLYRPPDRISYAWVACFWLFGGYAVYLCLLSWHTDSGVVDQLILRGPPIPEFGSGMRGGAALAEVVKVVELLAILYGINRILVHRYQQDQPLHSFLMTGA